MSTAIFSAMFDKINSIFDESVSDQRNRNQHSEVHSSFGLCSKSTYDSLVHLISRNQFEDTKVLINEIYSQLENSASKLENDKCSGEVFIALFDYFKTAFEINIRGNMGRKELGENWLETTGDYDMIAFFEKEKIHFSSCAGTIDYDAASQYINDFFQNDYVDAGQIACNVFLENLGKLDTDTVLIFHLYEFIQPGLILLESSAYEGLDR